MFCLSVRLHISYPHLSLSRTPYRYSCLSVCLPIYLRLRICQCCLSLYQSIFLHLSPYVCFCLSPHPFLTVFLTVLLVNLHPPSPLPGFLSHPISQSPSTLLDSHLFALSLLPPLSIFIYPSTLPSACLSLITCDLHTAHASQSHGNPHLFPLPRHDVAQLADPHQHPICIRFTQTPRYTNIKGGVTHLFAVEGIKKEKKKIQQKKKTKEK